MKHFKLFYLLICLSSYCSYGQAEIIGSEEYGRLFYVQYDNATPDKLYALTMGNHIVTSNNNGDTWEILFSMDNTKASLKGLKVLPSSNNLSFYSNNTLYILDVNTLQISWSSALPIPSVSTNEWVTSYAIFPEDSQKIIASQGFKGGSAIANSKAYYTSDGGQNWEEIYYSGDNSNIQLNAVAMSPIDANRLFLLRGQGSDGLIGGLLISQDAGQTWQEKLAGFTLNAYDFHPDVPQEMLIGTDIAFGDHDEKLFKTTDNGASWDSIPIAWSDMTLDNITAIKYNPIAPDTILVLEENEVLISEDGFTTWDNYVYPTVDTHSYYYGLNASFNPVQPGEVIVTSNFHVLFSENNGEDLEWAKNPYFTSSTNMYISQSANENHLYYGVQFGYVHKNLGTDVETPHFVKSLDFFSTDPTMPILIDKKIPGRVNVFKNSLMGHELVVSANHGSDYTSVYSSFKSDFDVVASYPTNDKKIIASFSNEGAQPELVKIDFSDPMQVMTTNISLPINERVSGIYINNTADTLTISLGASIYKSTDEGQTWIESNDGLEALSPQNDRILDLAYNPLNENQLGIATSQGIFLSDDQGETWENIKSGIFNKIEFSPITNGHIVATTYSALSWDYAFHYSGDAGATWESMEVDDLLYIQSGASATLFNNDGTTAEIYIGTSDLGVIKVHIDFNTLGIPDYSLNENWLVHYPNPVESFLNLKMKRDGKIKSTRIYTMSGKLVQRGNATKIGVSALSPGIYIIKITTTDGKQTVKRFIKK